MFRSVIRPQQQQRGCVTTAVALLGRRYASSIGGRILPSTGANPKRMSIAAVVAAPSWPLPPAAHVPHTPAKQWFSTAATATASSSSTSLDPIFVPDMLCRQCEQTANHVGCTTQGVCGKSSETSALQDALLDSIKSLSLWCVAARKIPSITSSDVLEKANIVTLQGVFSTLTNVNFSPNRIANYIRETEEVKEALQAQILAALGNGANLQEILPSVIPEDEYGTLASLSLHNKTDTELEEYGQIYSSLTKRANAMDHVDAFAWNEFATYGLKGACAYAAHVYRMVGHTDPKVMENIHEILAKLASTAPDVEGLLATALRVGEVNGQIMADLDAAHANMLGVPEPTQVRTSAMAGKAILVSGHDLPDLYALLQATEGTGVNVYTHGEMLPAHAYPKLKAFPHLVGNYGTTWVNQKFEFASFPGPIIVTTNCIQEPRRVYQDRLYSMNEVGVDGVRHIQDHSDFAGVIEQAQQMKGFPRDVTPATFHTTGFNHRAVLPLAGKILEANRTGALSRIFLIGGCDGSQWNRSYFTTLAEETPTDSLILTLGCAKNRLIHNPALRDATLSNGLLPRVLDMGQCNDSYSALVVATELAKALKCSVNDLPLSIALSFLEQKSVAVLLTLLSLGIQNIRLGPSLPAYMTPNVLGLLAEKYNLKGLGEPDEDLKAMMSGN